jgi:hypothetical protein
VPTTMAMTPDARPARPRRWPGVLAWGLAGLTVLSLVPVSWLAELVWSTGWEPRPATAPLGAVGLATVSTATVGALVASRRPRHPVGWLLLGVGLALQGSLLVQSYVDYGLLARPGSLPGARYLAGFAYSTVLIWVSWAGFVLLLTPTGRLPSPRWRWWARLAVATPVLMVLGSVVQPDPLAPDYHGNPLAVPALARVLVVPGRGRRCDHPGLAAGGGRVAGVRFRRARGVERQQLRWLAYAAALAAGLLLVALVARIPPGQREPGAHVPDPVRGAAAAGDRRGDPALSAVRHRPYRQPHRGLWAVDGPVGWRLRRRGAWARPAAATRLQPGGGRGDPGGGGGVPAGPPPHPGAGRPAVQPPVGCQKSVCHGAQSYSWISPPRTSRPRGWPTFGALPASPRSDGSGVAKARLRCGRCRL